MNRHVKLKENAQFNEMIYKMNLKKSDVMDTLRDSDGHMPRNPHEVLKRALNHPIFGRFCVVQFWLSLCKN